MLHLEGLSAAEIQTVTGLTAGNVATRLTRIRQNLAAQIEKEHGSRLYNTRTLKDNERAPCPSFLRGGEYYSTFVNSTRRLFAFPSGESFFAIGFVDP